MKITLMRGKWMEHGGWPEVFRPWKFASFLAGTGLLITGAFYYQYSDWDVGISLIMGLLTYLTAPWSVRMLLTRQYRFWPLVLVFWYVSVDGCYWVYHTILGHEMIRDWNLYTSTPLFFLMGCIWLYNGSLKELALEIRAAVIGSG